MLVQMRFSDVSKGHTAVGLTQASTSQGAHSPFGLLYHHPTSSHSPPSILGPRWERLAAQDFHSTFYVVLPLGFFPPSSFGMECLAHPVRPHSFHFHPFSPPGPVENLLIRQSCDASSGS